jgi:UDP-N-acetylglucosamine 1-carboxyvinyltransferase
VPRPRTCPAYLLTVIAGPDSNERIVVRRSGPLSGSISVPGAKNSVLKLMAATLMADGVFHLDNVPDIADVATMADLLAALGVSSQHDSATGVLTMTSGPEITPVAPYELAERIRASINVLGPLLGRFGKVTLSLPGGDDFGSRPIDMHLRGLEAMGAEFTLRHGDVDARISHGDRLHGASIVLEFPSVGATENILTAAVHAKGTTIIDNAAREPEIADLCNLLVAMGADIEGIGSPTLVVHGVEPGSLRPTRHRVVADRIQAATYIAAVAVCGGEVVLRGARGDHMEMLLRRLREMGVVTAATPPAADGSVATLAVFSDERLRAIDVATLPYPGIATDYKPLIVAMLAVADGVGIVTENLYPGRFRYVEELQRLGADVRTDGHHAVVRGVERLSGAPVRAPDIRAGAALVIAGLAADGATTISDIHHVDRGYDDLVGRLAAIGATISRS